MASAVTVHTLVDERAYTATHRVPGPPVVRPIDARRLVEHLVAEVAHELLAISKTDPTGLIITVTAEPLPNGLNYVVTGSLPQDSELGVE